MSNLQTFLVIWAIVGLVSGYYLTKKDLDDGQDYTLAALFFSFIASIVGISTLYFLVVESPVILKGKKSK